VATDLTTTQALGQRIRRVVLEQSMRAGVGHIGSALSIADLLAAVYGGILPEGDPGDPDRDRFVLSKGHAVLALYGALQAHPEHALTGVDFSTGSLGQGLSMAAGAALAARIHGSERRSIALLSDAEGNEGSVWEAAMFAAHHDLANLIAIIDVNGQQALGYTRDVLDLDPLAERWRAFGWDVHEADGHDPDALVALVQGFDTTSGPPHVVLAQTTFGKGVSFMESQIAWHYWPLSEEQFELAVRELEESVR
jgi:transketolase